MLKTGIQFGILKLMIVGIFLFTLIWLTLYFSYLIIPFKTQVRNTHFSDKAMLFPLRSEHVFMQTGGHFVKQTGCDQSYLWRVCSSHICVGSSLEESPFLFCPPLVQNDNTDHVFHSNN